VADREVDLKPIIVPDLPQRVAHVQADRTDRGGDAQPGADSREEVREREVGDLRLNGADVEEGDAP
jgi:hypothetical protein